MNHLLYFCERFQSTSKIVDSANDRPINTVTALDFFDALEQEAYNSLGEIPYSLNGRLGSTNGKNLAFYYMAEREAGRSFSKEEAAIYTKMVMRIALEKMRLLFDKHYNDIPEWVKATRMCMNFACGRTITGH